MTAFPPIISAKPPGGVPARSVHPGSGRRKTRDQQKGRQVDPVSLDEVRELLGDRSRQADLLIEHLHLLQDHYGCLHARHLAALAKEMKLALVEVFEVASFYAHFDIVMDGEPAPPKLTIRVCDSLSCALAGAEQLHEALKAGVDERDVRVVRAPCMGGCNNAPVVAIGHAPHENATVESVLDAVAHGHTHPEIPNYLGFDEYIRNGGYKMLAECLDGARDVDAVLKMLEDSSIRGLGGAGFPTGLKWRYVRAEPGPRMMAINGDEGEPGTFKDRFHLERDPHRFLEGMLIGAWTVEATDVYIYLRDEYPQCREILLREIPKVEAAGLARHTRIHLRRGAGAYICGEESAMLESIEGKRGLPRHKPPFPSVVGLFGRPTLINNIETVFWVREILEKGGAWFASHGANGRKGLRTFSVSGRVKEPGVKLAPAGITLQELVDQYCGGMAEGHTLKGYLPGGPSGGILPASMANIPLDFGTLEPHGSFIGSAAVVVLSDKDNMRDVALNLLKFFEDESCGQCTPCRVGTEKAVRLISEPEWDEELLKALATVMGDASICGLGQAAMNPIKLVMKHFRDDFVSRQGTAQGATGSQG
ncbi:Tungsten-containing formate dehydrogenase beta subunit [Azospirillum largimobile]